MSKNLSAEKSFSAIAANTAGNPEATAPPNQPLYMLKRIGSTTYKVAVHFSSDRKETAGDKIARLIRNEAEWKAVN